LEPVEGK